MRRSAADRRAEAERLRQLTEAADWEVFLREYHRRFVNLLYGFMDDGSLKVERVNEDEFRFYRNDRYHYSPIHLTIDPPEVYDPDYMRKLENAEEDLAQMRADREAEARAWQAKMAALAKLTPEERGLLGL